MKVKRYLVFSLSILIAFVWGCSAAYQAVKKGDELLEMKNHYGAAQEYLKALGHESDRKDAKMKLCQIAKPAYDQKLALAVNFEKASDFESALPHYEDLSTFLERVNSHGCLNFSPINAKQKIVEMKSAASEKYYTEAEHHFGSGDYSNAIRSYNEALRHNTPYKDSKEKVAESYYRIAANAEKQKTYRDAAKNYLKANSATEGYKDATQRATQLYYSLGEYFLSKDLCRNAWNDFNEASKINPGFKDISDKLSKSDACAISKIAFVKFDNPTRRDIAGMSMGDFIFDEIKSELQKNCSKFVRTLDRDELETILSEQKLGMSGITDEYSTFKRLKGVHYLIFGKLTQVNSVRPAPKEENLRTTGKQGYDCSKGYDKKGREITGTCYRDVTVSYTKHSDKISVSLSGSIKVVSVSTGEQLIFHNITANRSDSVTYADITSDISSVSIPSSLKDLSNAKKELKDEDSLARGMVAAIAEEMVGKILDKVDRVKSVTDPVEMKMYR